MGDHMGPGPDSESRIAEANPESQRDQKEEQLDIKGSIQMDNDQAHSESHESEPEKGEVEEISMTDQQLIMTRKKEFDTLYKYMRRFQEEHWTVLQIESQSKRLKEIFQSWREVFMTAGISRERTNKLIKIALDEARNMRSKGGLTFQFEKRMFTRGKMAERTPILKFFKTFVKGLKGELDEEVVAEERQENAQEEQLKTAA